MPLDLTEKQKMGLELLQDPDKQYILFTGGSRSGKTYLIMEFLVGRAFQFPGSRQLIVRKNLVDARNSIWDDSLPKYLSQYVPSSQYTLVSLVNIKNIRCIIISSAAESKWVLKSKVDCSVF